MVKPKRAHLSVKRVHISVNQAAEILEVDRTTVINMLHRGELQGFKKTLGLTSPYRVYVDSLERVQRARQSSAK